MYVFINPGYAPNGIADPGAVAPDETAEWKENQTVASDRGNLADLCGADPERWSKSFLIP